MLDLRLYVYSGFGSLEKVGRNKSQLFKPDKHFFTDIDELKEHINWLRKNRDYYKNKQFIILEYNTFEKENSRQINSKIVEIINPIESEL